MVAFLAFMMVNGVLFSEGIQAQVVGCETFWKANTIARALETA